MDIFDSMISGFQVALTFQNVLYCFLGVLVGTTVGVLPGLGPGATIALLIPLTYSLPPETSLILLAGIYYGAMYGGSITSVLLDLPGEAASVVTTFDGYQMAKQGRAGAALGIAAIGSFIAGTVAIIGLTFTAPLLAELAVKFGPPEYAVVALVGIYLVAYLASQSVLKSILSAAFGLLLACIGQDPILGTSRFTFGSAGMLDGLDFAAMAMGLFGVGEILYSLEKEGKAAFVTEKLSRIWPTMNDWAKSKWAIARGSVLGFFVGILPGGGSILSSLLSYALEKRVSKHPETFGKGAIEGVAGPESANNSAATSSFIPLLTLGIPSNATMALMFGALMLHGVVPGPLLIEQHPDLFWGVVNSMYIGNVLLLLLNIPLIGIFVQLLKVREGILAPIAVMITLVGVFSINNSDFDMWSVLFFGVLGYLMRKFGYEPGPMVLAFVLGSIIETSFRQSLVMSEGSFGIFVTRPISGSIFWTAVLIIVGSFLIRQFRRRQHRAR